MAGPIVQLSDKQLNTIVALYVEHGLTQRVIASRYGISEVRVLNVLKRRGIPGKKGKSHRQWRKEVMAFT